jgi:hypothetical protein
MGELREHLNQLPSSISILFIQSGANDLTLRNSSPDDTKAELDGLIAQICTARPELKVFVILATYRTPSRKDIRHERFCVHYNRRISRYNYLLRTSGIAYVDPEFERFEPWRVLARDCFHPNRFGVFLICDTIKKCVLKWHHRAFLEAPTTNGYKLMAIPQLPPPNQDIEPLDNLNRNGIGAGLPARTSPLRTQPLTVSGNTRIDTNQRTAPVSAPANSSRYTNHHTTSSRDSTVNTGPLAPKATLPSSSGTLSAAQRLINSNKKTLTKSTQKVPPTKVSGKPNKKQPVPGRPPSDGGQQGEKFQWVRRQTPSVNVRRR